MIRLQEYEVDTSGSVKRGPEVGRNYFVVIEMARKLSSLFLIKQTLKLFLQDPDWLMITSRIDLTSCSCHHLCSCTQPTNQRMLINYLKSYHIWALHASWIIPYLAIVFSGLKPSSDPDLDSCSSCDLSAVTYIDSSAVQALKDLHLEYRSRGIQVKNREEGFYFMGKLSINGSSLPVSPRRSPSPTPTGTSCWLSQDPGSSTWWARSGTSSAPTTPSRSASSASKASASGRRPTRRRGTGGRRGRGGGPATTTTPPPQSPSFLQTRSSHPSVDQVIIPAL